MNAPAASRTPPTVDVPLRATGLVAGYGDLAVVHGVDIEVGAGEIVALLGPNGAGKSTTLLTLAGELAPLGGEVEWLGAPARGGLHSRAREGLGFVPEERSVFMSMSVRDNLLLGAGGVDPAVELFPELEKLLNRRAGLLSGGEQQMLTLARTLARAPRVVLADELSLGLAPIVVDRLMAAIEHAARTRNVGVILVEQQARRALRVADRWYLMRRGRVVANGVAADGAAELEAAYLADEAPSPA
ncbi:ABC transporter ATP-binding protein [Streptosporangium sp. CA-115845]|uniref:ABC transporter ATP-binding protein n=1 Tax=Streptosporangium sp. CA-115845 TaxID=3240071 RepID=UPI003D946EE4